MNVASWCSSPFTLCRIFVFKFGVRKQRTLDKLVTRSAFTLRGNEHSGLSIRIQKVPVMVYFEDEKFREVSKFKNLDTSRSRCRSGWLFTYNRISSGWTHSGTADERWTKRNLHVCPIDFL
jgi:hypothetical protein